MLRTLGGLSPSKSLTSTLSLSIGANCFSNLGWFIYPFHTLNWFLRSFHWLVQKVSLSLLCDRKQWSLDPSIWTGHPIFKWHVQTNSGLVEFLHRLCDLELLIYIMSLAVRLFVSFECATVGMFKVGATAKATSVLLREIHGIQMNCFQSENFHVWSVNESSYMWVGMVLRVMCAKFVFKAVFIRYVDKKRASLSYDICWNESEDCVERSPFLIENRWIGKRRSESVSPWEWVVWSEVCSEGV